jgi:predicted  nucleic acid-binding Zn-ribbon protein
VHITGSSISFRSASVRSPANCAGRSRRGTRAEGLVVVPEEAEFAHSRRPVLETERAVLDRERAELQQSDDALKAERASIDKVVQAAAEIGERSKALSAQTSDFNERVARFEAAPPAGPTAQRQRMSLERERAELEKSAKALESDRAALGPQAEQKAKAFDARLAARNQAAADWNARNARLTQSAQGFELELENWKVDCEGRSYREDDEKALLSGQ